MNAVYFIFGVNQRAFAQKIVILIQILLKSKGLILSNAVVKKVISGAQIKANVYKIKFFRLVY